MVLNSQNSNESVVRDVINDASCALTTAGSLNNINNMLQWHETGYDFLNDWLDWLLTFFGKSLSQNYAPAFSPERGPELISFLPKYFQELSRTAPTWPLLHTQQTYVVYSEAITFLVILSLTICSYTCIYMKLKYLVPSIQYLSITGT